MPTSTYRDDEHTDELLLYILLAVTGMLGQYALLWMVVHPVRTLKILIGLAVLMAVLAGVVAVFVFLGWWAIPLLGVAVVSLVVLDRAVTSAQT